MPLVVTSAEVEVYSELVRRLGQASTSLAVAAVQCRGLLGTARWTGLGATAGNAEEHRLAQALTTLGHRFGELAGRAGRRRDDLLAECRRRQALESALLNDLGHLARAPGDLESDARAEAARIKGALPLTGHQAWEQLHHVVQNLLF